MKGVAPIEVCDYILKNTPDVFNLLRKKDKDRDDFVGKLHHRHNQLLALGIKDKRLTYKSLDLG